MASLLVQQRLSCFVWLLLLLLVVPVVNGQTTSVIRVHYGYFPEARPTHAACARGWLDLDLGAIQYQVTCFPQTSGSFAVSRLDNAQLDVAILGSTPMAMAAARGVDLQVVYIEQYKGESQGIYVRASEDDNKDTEFTETETNYQGIQNPFDLKGRTVGVPFGSTIHYQLLFVLDLFGLQRSVNVLDMSPQEIKQAWDNKEIDAGACWGDARDYLLKSDGQGNPNLLPANTLLTSGVMANWGRATFNVVATRRAFAEDHPDFMTHLVGILSRLNDSYLDRLGEVDSQNVQRWDAQTSVPTSLVPSLVDALMKAGETPTNPSQKFLNLQRRALDLFVQQSAEEQLTCDYLGKCATPTLQHIGLRQTAEFLLDQKVISALGRMQDMGDYTACTDPNTLCGGDLLQPAHLQQAQQVCNNCHRVGPYGAINFAGKDNLLSELERLDAAIVKSAFASQELGRPGPGQISSGDSTCLGNQNVILSSNSFPTDFGDGADAKIGKSYSENRNCTWEFRSVSCRSASDACQEILELSFSAVRLWSGDVVRVYTDTENTICSLNAPNTLTLLAQVSGFYDDINLPPIRAAGCMLVHFLTDTNQERSYGDVHNLGDGFLAQARSIGDGCVASDDCNGYPCSNHGVCQCGGQAWGADCSFTDHCLGTNRIGLDALDPDEMTIVASSARVVSSEFVEVEDDVVDPSIAYPNDLDCSFEFQVYNNEPFVEVQVVYDLESTYDLLTLQSGPSSSLSSSDGGVDPEIVLSGMHEINGSERPERYLVPTDEHGMASLRLTTDSRGRRRGFFAWVRPADQSLSNVGVCENGYSGSGCGNPYCSPSNELGLQLDASENLAKSYALGRIISQTPERNVRPMPWSPTGGCVWPLLSTSKLATNAVAIRLIFNSRLDLEPHPQYFISDGGNDVGDNLVIRRNGKDSIFFVEKCASDEVCSSSWQTGTCSANGGCDVKQSVDADVSDFASADASVFLVTDRNDGGVAYKGLDLEVVLVAACPSEDGEKHCDAISGAKCVKGGCVCEGGIPCACPCDGDGPTLFENVRVGLVVGIVVPLFLIFIGVFLWYRRRKILGSRAQKQVIEAKEAELEAFRNSVVGMRTAIRDYIPRVAVDDSREMAIAPIGKVSVQPVARVTWCWQETSYVMTNHTAETIVGDPADCWIKYDDDSNQKIEAAFQEQGQLGTFSPLPGYVVDFSSMTQVKTVTGYRREVQRLVQGSGGAGQQVSEQKEIDLTDAQMGDRLPSELHTEPQMVLVTGDIVQISTQREDGWAFGTKLHHSDEASARTLVQVAANGAEEDEANVFTDTGWFQLDATEVPSAEDLAALQTSVGDTNALEPPGYWDDIVDPSLMQLHEVKAGDSERNAVVDAFMSTLKPPNFRRTVRVVKIERIQNLAMWQSYVVKRQTICYRETGVNSGDKSGNADNIKARALERFERRWLWHGTNIEVMDKIMQQGFNRSFCGKNATMYGKGVYFARDGSYSAYPTYSVPDKGNNQYIMACRVVVGEYCKGQIDAVTPDVRDATSQALYDTTVGLLSRDTMSDPSIYVTYHDAQAYPEYLIKFRSS